MLKRTYSDGILCPKGAREYVRTLQVAFDLQLSVGILRLQGGFDISSLGFTDVVSDGEDSRYEDSNLSSRPINLP